MNRLIVLSFVLLPLFIVAQFTKQDSIRGSITPERAWWNVMTYDLSIDVEPSTKTISGLSTILFQVLSTSDSIMQIDLMAPMQIDSVYFKHKRIDFHRISPTAYHVKIDASEKIEKHLYGISIYFSGTPIEAKNAPWDGGIVWTKDTNGNDFVASAIQGLGASAWWPCKDHWSDEPDWGMQITVSCPENVMAVSNGKLLEKITNDNNRTTTKWEVKNPINAYGVNFNVGDYQHWSETYAGIDGFLNLDFYVLRDNVQKAKEQFKDVHRMLEAFEHWFGPYPFYEDGYKLVEVPYLGMEHQSSVTYGNGFKNGYLGKDLSGTGWGLKWDFIIIHESGHEWFANNITAADPADMWIHEAFTTYSEGLFTEYFYGKEAGNAYIRGLRKNILNDRPMIGNYDVHHEGSYDMYSKGANMLHTIRQIVDNDSIWLTVMRSINRDFRHQTVTSAQIETYLSKQLNIELKSLFDVYLRTTIIPTLEIKQKKKSFKYRWSKETKHLLFPIEVRNEHQIYRIQPTHKKQRLAGNFGEINQDYYVRIIIK